MHERLAVKSSGLQTKAHRPNPAHCVLINKVYWNTTMFIHLNEYFYTTTAELSSYSRKCMAYKV